MFDQNNTTGYTNAQIATFNADLAAILVEIDEYDIDARTAAEKAFADRVAAL